MKLTPFHILTLILLALSATATAQRQRSTVQVMPVVGPTLAPQSTFNIIQYSHHGDVFVQPFWMGTGVTETFDTTFQPPLPNSDAQSLSSDVVLGDLTLNGKLDASLELHAGGGSIDASHIVLITGAEEPGAGTSPGFVSDTYNIHSIIFEVTQKSTMYIESSAQTFYAAGDPAAPAPDMTHRAEWILVDLEADATAPPVASASALDSPNGNTEDEFILNSGTYELIIFSDMLDDFPEGYINQDVFPCINYILDWQIFPFLSVGGGVLQATPQYELK